MHVGSIESGGAHAMESYGKRPDKDEGIPVALPSRVSQHAFGLRACMGGGGTSEGQSG